MILPPQSKPIIRDSKNSGSFVIKQNNIKRATKISLCDEYTVYINDPSLGRSLVCTRYKNDKTR